MIGRLDKSKEVTVVGAGISGLLVTYYLDRAGYRVRLVEAAERGGGMISTRQSEQGYGIAENAAHSFPATPAIRELCSELGVELEGLHHRERWIFRSGRLRRFPLTIGETLRVFFRAYFMLAPAQDPESLPLDQWARRFLGKSALNYLITPFVRGIYGSAPGEISMGAAFPFLCVPRGHSLLSYLLARRWRSHPPSAVRRDVRSLPRGEIVAPKGGMEAFVSALARDLEKKLGDRFEKNRKLEDLKIVQGNLILCTPAGEAARLLQTESPELSRALAEIRYSPLTTATVFVRKAAFPKNRPPRGLGVLIPETESLRSLGVLFNSSAFDGRVSGEELVSLTMMFAGTPEGDLRGIVEKELRTLFGVLEPPLEVLSRAWERAIPKYDARLLSTWELAEKTWCARPGRILFGNYTGQVSIRGMVELARALPSLS